MGVGERSDARAVPRRILTLPRLTAVAAVVLLVSATISLAADKPMARKPAHAAKPRQVLVVPAIRGQAFVFASGTLEDAGFGWKVRGSVHGFPANVVVRQQPKAGTRVFNTGAPTITLWLAPGKAAQIGVPQDRSPYGASLIRRVGHSHSR
jgi:beta-lactam-binding protein with PASTA domain